MKKNIYDDVLSGVTKVVNSVSIEVANEFKGANPFDKVEMPFEEVNEVFEELLLRMAQPQIPDEDLSYLIETYGEESISKRFQEIQQERIKRGMWNG